MKKNILTSLTVIALSAVLIMSGCESKKESSKETESETIVITENAPETESETVPAETESTVETETELITKTETEASKPAVVDTNGLREALASCEGIGQTAGYSLKITTAAYNLFSWCAENDAAGGSEAVKDEIGSWYRTLSEKYQNVFMDCLPDIISTVDNMISDPGSIEGDLNDAGVYEDVIAAREGVIIESSWKALSEILPEAGDIAH